MNRANPVIAKVVVGLHQTFGLLRVAFSQAVLLEVYLMARIPKIWYRKERKAWFVTIHGNRHNLGPNKKEATDRFHQLMGTTHHKPIRSMNEQLESIVAPGISRICSWPENISEWNSFRRRVKALLNYRGISASNIADRVAHRSVGTILKAISDNSNIHVSLSDIYELSQVLRIPRVILDDVFVPGFRHCVVVNRDDGWVEPPPYADVMPSAEYRVPCRKLSHSDIDVNRLLLTEGGHSPENDHPGFELLICVSGSVRLLIKIDETEHQDLEIQEGSFVHYESRHRHSVHHVKGTPAEAYVIRFMENREHVAQRAEKP